MSNCRLTQDGQEFFTSYDEVYDSFDSMGLQENLLRGIYAYGRIAYSLIMLIMCSYYVNSLCLTPISWFIFCFFRF